MNANDLTFGIEIETIIPAGATNVGPHGHGYQVSFLPQGWLADRDPSIQTESGFIACEFVSPVLKGAEGIKQVIDAVNAIKARGGKVNASCGLHIHVYFDRTNREGLKRLMTLVANYEKAIFASTGTKARENGRWCGGLQRYGNIDNAARGAETTRYHVLNVTNLSSGRKPTVEFRAFAASLNVVKIVGYIRLCVGMVERAVTAKKVTKFTAKRPVESSPIYRKGGQGQTELTRLFYQLGWTKGRTKYTYGNIQADGAPSFDVVKKELMRLAKKYDGR